MKIYIWVIIVVLILVVIGLILVINKSTSNEPIIAKLINVTGGEYVPSANYYEGALMLSDISSNKTYSIFACSLTWDWVKQDACYKFSPEDINVNIKSHERSMELSGCYVGTLEQVNC